MARLLKTALRGVIPDEQISEIETGIDIIGDIAITRLNRDTGVDGSTVGEAILRTVKSVKAVYDQEGAIEGEYRLRTLRHLAGEVRTMTTHRENGCVFRVDVESCYFSPRLATERMRINGLSRDGEDVLNMFAGVGPYTIQLAKRGATAVSCELNQAAFALHVENNRLNKVTDRITMVEGRAEELPARLGSRRFDRVLMPHPSMADKYLPMAKAMTKERGWVHYYRHVSAPDIEEGDAKMRDEVRTLIAQEPATVHKVRVVGPKLLELVADIRVA